MTITAAKNTATALRLRYTPAVYASLDLARQSTAHAAQSQAVMLGEGAFWVVCMADAAKLEAAGFEWAV